MYRKLMFLISFVALLGLVNIVSADDWDGDTSTDWCDGANWDDGSAPGPGDDAVLKVTGNDPLILGPACSPDFDKLEWDLDSSDAITLNIVDATVRFMENEESGEGLMTMTISGTSNVDCWDDRIRWGNHGHGVLNISDDAVLHVNGDLRGGDEDDGAFDLNMSDGLLVVEGEILCGDDGSGVLTFTGGEVVCERFTISARKGGQTGDMVVSGDTEIYIGGGDDPELRLGKDCKEDGGVASLTMTGGIVSAEYIRLSASEESCTHVNVDIQGGLLIAREELIVAEDDGVVTVTISGGEIQVLGDDSLEIDDNGSIDLCGGTLVLAGNKAAEIAELVCVDGKITGYGIPAGVVIDYGNLNPGKTTVYGVEGVDPEKAYCPEPANGADKVQCVTTDVELCWTGGSGVDRLGGHRVFFGTDEAAVETATTSSDEYLGQTRANITCYIIGNGLPLWTDHFWRIDEVNDDFTVTPGDVWKFTTGCEAIDGDTNNDCILNFLDYADVASTWQEEQLWP